MDRKSEQPPIEEVFDIFAKEVVGSFRAPTVRQKKECGVRASNLARQLAIVPEELQPILRLKLDELSDSNHNLAKAVRNKLRHAIGKDSVIHNWWK